MYPKDSPCSEGHDVRKQKKAGEGFTLGLWVQDLQIREPYMLSGVNRKDRLQRQLVVAEAVERVQVSPSFNREYVDFHNGDIGTVIVTQG